jgi:hypothetical protein
MTGVRGRITPEAVAPAWRLLGGKKGGLREAAVSARAPKSGRYARDCLCSIKRSDREQPSGATNGG